MPALSPFMCDKSIVKTAFRFLYWEIDLGLQASWKLQAE